jgi:hypothetical protein
MYPEEKGCSKVVVMDSGKDLLCKANEFKQSIILKE